MWSRTYCCVAVPLYNSGIYLILAQFLIISLTTAILSFAAPTIVAVAIPSFAPFLFGAVCIAVAVLQVAGFFGVYRERPTLFKTYAKLNAILVSIALIIALAFIILSAVRHSTAVINCEALFTSQVGSVNAATGLLSGIATGNVTSASGICQIWTWVQLGIMGLLFVIIALCEAYFLMYQSIYLVEQKADHARYDSVYSTAEREIRESGLWDHDVNSFSRPSEDDITNYRQHGQRRSMASGLRNELPRHESQEYPSGSGPHGYHDNPNANSSPGSLGDEKYTSGSGGSGGNAERFRDQEDDEYPNQTQLHQHYQQGQEQHQYYSEKPETGGGHLQRSQASWEIPR